MLDAGGSFTVVILVNVSLPVTVTDPYNLS